MLTRSSARSTSRGRGVCLGFAEGLGKSRPDPWAGYRHSLERVFSETRGTREKGSHGAQDSRGHRQRHSRRVIGPGQGAGQRLPTGFHNSHSVCYPGQTTCEGCATVDSGSYSILASSQTTRQSCCPTSHLGTCAGADRCFEQHTNDCRWHCRDAGGRLRRRHTVRYELQRPAASERFGRNGRSVAQAVRAGQRAKQRQDSQQEDE